MPRTPASRFHLVVILVARVQPPDENDSRGIGPPFSTARVPRPDTSGRLRGR